MAKTTQLESDIRAAAQRLRGQLVATPLIGGLRLPGFQIPPDLRLKPEVLQPGGALRYRGALHYLMRKLGGLKGLVLWGEPRQILADAMAAKTQRLPTTSFWKSDPGAWGEQLQACGCAVEQVTDPATAAQAHGEKTGFHLLPPNCTEPDFLVGLATVGLELAAELPRDCPLVVVSSTGSGLQAGLRAGGHSARVEEVDRGSAPAGLHEALRTGHRLESDPEGLAALAWALDHGRDSVCAVLAS